MENQNKYRKRATLIEMLFASWLGLCLNASTNFANYFSYYLTGIVGIGTVLAGSFITIFRIWDAFTDIGMGTILDRTNTKIGKFRPWIFIGAVTVLISSWCMVNVPVMLPEKVSLRLTAYVISYMVFVVGTTMMNPAARAAGQILTEDPKQRATIGMIRGVSIQTLYSVLPVIVFSHIIPKTKGFNLEFFRTYWFVFAAIILVFSGLAFYGFKDKDTYQESVETKRGKGFDWREAVDVVKHNRPLQMLVLSAGSDKLATVCQSNATIVVILYAIVAGNAKLNSGANSYTLIPCILMIILGLGGVARKFGSKKSMLFGSIGGIVVCALSILLWVFGDPRTFNFPGYEGFEGWSFFTLAFLVLWCLYKGFTMVTSNVTNPMIADVIDYEQYRSGKYVPGLVSSLFTFSDKVISSLAPTLVSFMIAAIGFQNELPTIDTPFSNKLFAIGLFGMYGIVIIGLIVNLIAMKLYSLTPEMMEEIRVELHRRKEAEGSE